MDRAPQLTPEIYFSSLAELTFEQLSALDLWLVSEYRTKCDQIGRSVGRNTTPEGYSSVVYDAGARDQIELLRDSLKAAVANARKRLQGA